jgi:hypothetical protein
MSRRFVRIAAVLTLALALAVPAAQAAGPFRAAASRAGLLDMAWSWLASLWSATSQADKGFTIDPDGGTADGDKGYSIDPDGLTVQGADPRTSSDETDKGFTIDPNG